MSSSWWWVLVWGVPTGGLRQLPFLYAEGINGEGINVFVIEFQLPEHYQGQRSCCLFGWTTGNRGGVKIATIINGVPRVGGFRRRRVGGTSRRQHRRSHHVTNEASRKIARRHWDGDNGVMEKTATLKIKPELLVVCPSFLIFVSLSLYFLFVDAPTQFQMMVSFHGVRLQEASCKIEDVLLTETMCNGEEEDAHVEIKTMEGGADHCDEMEGGWDRDQARGGRLETRWGGRRTR